MNIFIFNRGLRIYDNTTLIHQIKQMGDIVPIFIFTPEQIDKEKNKYFSNNSVQFMIESLHELSKEIADKGGKLYFFKGDNIDVMGAILAKSPKGGIKSVGMNFDYTPYARLRSDRIKKFCKENNITFYEKEDYLLHREGEGMKKDGTPYLVFTPFKNYCIKSLKVAPVDKFNSFKFCTLKDINKIKYFLPEEKINAFYTPNPNINIHGGCTNGLRILKNLKKFSLYKKERDMLTYNTTFLAAHNHYMTISIREEYWAIVNILGKSGDGIISELYWREFYTIIVYNFPYVLNGQLGKLCNGSFKHRFDKIKLPPFNKEWFNAWCEGKTGFPIIDAGMRQLNLTGFMHNRCRMVTMCFLVKMMHIDWRYGEQYFATMLVDYDAMMNNSGAQWCASCGTDAQPYFRLFNPFLQLKNYDPKCEYVKKYIKELRGVDNTIIHNWGSLEKLKKNNINVKDIKYPPPILEYSKEKDIALKIFKAIHPRK